ncbi:MAG: hypothetical protein JW966_14485 [Anaerolineae bacterium]|nr:hypothetical protein [Anaerolineae bacterium]
MLNPFRIFRRLAWLTVLMFGGSTAVVVAAVVLATGGLGSRDLVVLPGEQEQIQKPDIQVELNEVVEKRPIFDDVPLPDDVSRDPDVITTNASLAIILALLLGTISTVLGNLIREEEETFRRWFSVPIIRDILKTLSWGAGQNVRQGCLTFPVILVVFALYGFIFAFLEDGLNLLSPEGLQLALVMAMSIGLISLSGDVARRQVARFWRQTTRFGLYPANLLIAVVTTALSRGVRLSPGIVFGAPGGVDIDLDDQPLLREVVLAFVTLVVMIVLGVMGWGAAAAVREVGDRTMSVDQAEFAGPLLQLGLTIGLALFLVAVETSFFEMVPLTATLGSEIFRWNRIVWLITFAPVMFLFAHVLLNPEGEYLQAFEQANVQVLSAVIVILGTITAALWVYFRVLHQEPVPVRQQVTAPPPAAIRPPQPPVSPPSQFSPPTMRATRDKIPGQPVPGQPAAPGYVPPPIVIGEDAPPPPIVIEDTAPPVDARPDSTLPHVDGSGPADKTRFAAASEDITWSGKSRDSGRVNGAPDDEDNEDTVILDDSV